jgi:hypothetical protein
MAAFILWLLAGAALGYSLWARHLLHYMVNVGVFVLCAAWVVIGVGFAATRARRAEPRLPVGHLSPEDVDRLIKKAREQEAQSRVAPGIYPLAQPATVRSFTWTRGTIFRCIIAAASAVVFSA